MLKRFPLKARLSITFGLLFVVSMTTINFISIRSSRLTLEQQAASHLVTVAQNQAAIFEQTYIEKFRKKMEKLERVYLWSYIVFSILHQPGPGVSCSSLGGLIVNPDFLFE